MYAPFPKLHLLLPATLVLLFITLSFSGFGQIGIGTNTPDPHAILTISSTTKGVLPPRLTATQQTALMSTLTATEKGMLVIDATTGNLVGWTGSSFAPVASFSAQTPLTVSITNQVSLNPGTKAGDLISWDGVNWVNKQPAIQHYTSPPMDNHQPYLAINYCIAIAGIFPSRADIEPFLSQIQAFGLNFPPQGWAFCDGSILPIQQNAALFSLLGITYGGDGISNFALPDLRGRIPIGLGQAPGLSSYMEGQKGGSETNTFLK